MYWWFLFTAEIDLHAMAPGSPENGTKLSVFVDGGIHLDEATVFPAKTTINFNNKLVGFLVVPEKGSHATAALSSDLIWTSTTDFAWRCTLTSTAALQRESLAARMRAGYDDSSWLRARVSPCYAHRPVNMDGAVAASWLHTENATYKEFTTLSDMLHDETHLMCRGYTGQSARFSLYLYVANLLWISRIVRLASSNLRWLKNHLLILSI